MKPKAKVKRRTGSVSGAFFRKGRQPSAIAMTIMMPPMVGVPLFFKCDWGPSSLTCWPNFMR